MLSVLNRKDVLNQMGQQESVYCLNNTINGEVKPEESDWKVLFEHVQSPNRPCQTLYSTASVETSERCTRP